MAQLVVRLLTTQEVRGSNPVISKLLYGTFVYCQLYGKDENKEKEAVNGLLQLFESENTHQKGKYHYTAGLSLIRLHSTAFRHANKNIFLLGRI